MQQLSQQELCDVRTLLDSSQKFLDAIAFTEYVLDNLEWLWTLFVLMAFGVIYIISCMMVSVTGWLMGHGMFLYALIDTIFSYYVLFLWLKTLVWLIKLHVMRARWHRD